MHALHISLVSFWPWLKLQLRSTRFFNLYNLTDDSVGSRNKLIRTGDSCFITRMQFCMTETITPLIRIYPHKNRKRRALPTSTCNMFALATMLVCLLFCSSKGTYACCDCLTPNNNCTAMWVFDLCWYGIYSIDILNWECVKSSDANIDCTL